jgi:glycosyltransferase involved in cell wall biosynthesis
VTVNAEPTKKAAELGREGTQAGRAVGRACVVVPAYDAAKTVAEVVADLRRVLPEACAAPGALVVVDDGSRDGTGEIAARAGAHVIAHASNRGKGAALATGLAYARDHGFDVALAVDADGQHPAESARVVLEGSSDARALVLGVRDLAGAGAPRANRFSNGVSNFFLSRFAGVALADTQCGLRRYPVNESIALGVRAEGYAFEAEVILRAVAGGLPVIEVPVRVVYPPAEERVSHFDVVRDPARIVAVVVRTLHELRRG